MEPIFSSNQLFENVNDKKLKTPIKAGNLKNHLDFWTMLTSDVNILEIVQGYKIEFSTMPYQHNPRITPVPKNSLKLNLIQEEIDSLLQKQAIIQVQETPQEFISTIFLVPKKSGGMRPIINLKPLNNYVETIHFKMETLQTALNLLQKGDYLVSVDLKDAYFSIPIYHQHRKYLRFLWKNQRYEFQCLPFGLKSAPRIFTKCTKPVMSALRSRGHRGIIYIDDSLWMAKTAQAVKETGSTVVKIFQQAGFQINEKKSSLQPTQLIMFLGYVIDTVQMTVSLPREKVQQILKEIQNLLLQIQPKIRSVAHVIGLLVSAFPAVYQGPLHYRYLERDKTKALLQVQSYQGKMTISSESIMELKWWIQNLETHNGKPVQFQDPTIVITTDASKKGWGGRDEPTQSVRQMVIGRDSVPYKFPGIKSSSICTDDFGQSSLWSEYSNSGRQQDSSGLLESHGRNSFNINEHSCKGNMGMGNSEEDSSDSGSHSRSGEHECRLFESAFYGSDGMAVEPTNNLQNISTTFPARSRPICKSPKFSDSTLCVMATRSYGLKNRCFLNSMEKSKSLCFSSIQSNIGSASKSLKGRSSSNTDNSALENTTMVSTSPSLVLRKPNTPPNSEQFTDIALRSRTKASNGKDSQASRVDSVRKRFITRGFSKKTAEILSKAWRTKTNKQYQSAWRLWLGWCGSRSVDPFQPSIVEVVEFLSCEFQKNKSYSAINSYRSTLSTTIPPIGGFPIGKHPIVVQFMKGVYNLKPVVPKYACVWDVSVVLKFLNSLPCNDELSLKDLTHKLAILIALVSADRGQSISFLDLNYLKIFPTKAVFVINQLTKTSRPGKPAKRIILPAYTKCVKLCVKSVLQCYINRTKELRSNSMLFVSIFKPHKQVTSCTIARWIKSVLIRSGITGYGAHSTRSASTSAALEAGLSVKDIMNVADWSNASTFNKFYKKVTGSSDVSFGKTILQSST